MPEMPVNDESANRTLDLIVKRLEDLNESVRRLGEELRSAIERDERRGAARARSARR